TSSKLYIWPNKTFAPGGTITLLGNAQASPSGDIHIANGATLTAGGNISVAGNWIASSTATFTPSTYTVTMTATTTGKDIWTVPVSTAKFYDLTFNGSGGAWTFKSSSATTTNNFTITAGTVTAPVNLYVGNNYANSGTFTAGTGAVWMTGTGGSDTVTPGSSTFYDLTFNGSGGSWSFGTNSATTTNNFTITLGTVTAPNNLYITGSYSNSGTFTHNSGRIIFNATGAKTITAGGVASDFFQLDFNGAGGQWTFVGAATSTATTTITQGTVIQAAAANLDLASFNIGASGVFTAASGVGVIYFEDDDPIFIADNRASKTTLGNVYIGYSPAIANQSSDLAVTSLTINSGDTHNTRGYEIDSSGAITVNGTGVLNANSSAAGETNGSVITVGTDWTIGASATFTAEEPGSASTTVYFDENTAGTITPGGTDANHDFWNFIVQKSAAQTVTLAGAIDVNNDIEITGSNSTFDVSASNYAITAGGSWLNTGNFTAR
ncbi:MAG: hypothetical protein Q7J73_05750, partial [Dehalococcoidales bacterium]|nr:hypothetical protein [Dehalococcoidales bacterium]